MRLILAAIVLTSLAALSPSSASAQGFRIGPDGIRIEPRRERDWDRRDWERRGWERRRWERRGERCRVYVERRRNRFGELVIRRTRVCR